jgi:hypothetical protein
MPIVATGFSCRDQDHRRALQSLLSGELPRADRHYLRLRCGLNAILPDGCAAARGVDEAASRGAPGGMALRDRQTGWQGSLGWRAAFPDAFNRLSGLDRSFVEAGHREAHLPSKATGQLR